jgi:hypothetical protein
VVEDDARHHTIKKKVIPLDGGADQTGKDDFPDIIRLAAAPHSIHCCIRHDALLRFDGYGPTHTPPVDRDVVSLGLKRMRVNHFLRRFVSKNINLLNSPDINSLGYVSGLG